MPTWFEIQCQFRLNGHGPEELSPNYLKQRYSRQTTHHEYPEEDPPENSSTISVDPKWPNYEGSLDIKRPCFIFSNA